jgi:hypothetical protein
MDSRAENEAQRRPKETLGHEKKAGKSIRNYPFENVGATLMATVKFDPGQLVATRAAAEAFAASGESLYAYVLRHVAGDWGDLDPDDVIENELSLRHGFRLFSCYRLNSGVKVWCITEADRSVTTFLLPEEY